MAKEKIETPTLAQVLRDVLESRLCDVHTALPGEIVSYSSITKLATVKPLLKRKYATGELVSLPNIQNVPVNHPRTKDSGIHLPIKKGDGVLIVFIERSIDKWISQGGEVSPEDPRKHSLSDAICIPGLFSQVDPITVDEPDALTIKNKDMTIELFDDGKVKLKNKTEELVDLMSQMADKLSTTTVNTIFGPLQLNDFAFFATLKTKIDLFKK